MRNMVEIMTMPGRFSRQKTFAHSPLSIRASIFRLRAFDVYGGDKMGKEEEEGKGEKPLWFLAERETFFVCFWGKAKKKGPSQSTFFLFLLLFSTFVFGKHKSKKEKKSGIYSEK